MDANGLIAVALIILHFSMSLYVTVAMKTDLAVMNVIKRDPRGTRVGGTRDEA